MNVDELLMLNHDAINYQDLSDDVLQALALEIEPYIATSALSELSIRRGELAGETAWTLLTRPESDRHLRSRALEVLFKVDPARASSYMRSRIAECDADVLTTMMEIVLENRAYFSHGPQSGLPQALAKCVEGLRSPTPAMNLDVTRAFLREYGHANVA